MSRQRRTRSEILKMLVFATSLVALTPATGCAILSPPAPRSGGDALSDAAKETRKKPEDQSTLAAGDKKDDCDHGGVGIAIAVDGDDRAERVPGGHPPVEREAHRPGRSLSVRGGLVAAGGSLWDGNFAPFTLYGARVGIEPAPRLRMDVAILGGPARFAPGSDVAALLTRPWELAGDLAARYSLTPPHAAVGVAPIIGVRAGTLFWTYRNGIRLERDGEVRDVSGDWIDHYAPYAGVALTFLRTSRVEVGAEALTGWRFYEEHTNEGLRNDLFRDTRFREFRLATTVRF